MKYIIEHLDKQLYKWCLIEYKHISEIVGRDNLIFTNVKEKDFAKLKNLGKFYSQRASELGLKNICILDPEAERTLSREDSKFEYMLLGGILGNNPALQRTKKEFGNLNFEKRNLGKGQMSTNTAAFVAKEILKGKELKDFKFQDTIEIEIKEGESIILPFRYVLINEKPILPEGFVEFLKKRKGF